MHVISLLTQGAKKIIFTACHSGELKLAFTSPDVISTSPKSFSSSRIDFTLLLLFEFLKEHHLPVGKLKIDFTSPIAKSTSPGLADTTFFARCYFKFHSDWGWVIGRIKQKLQLGCRDTAPLRAGWHLKTFCSFQYFSSDFVVTKNDKFITNYLNKFTISNDRTKTSRHYSKMSVTVFTEANATKPYNNCMPQVLFLSASLGLYIILSEPSSETNGQSAGWVGRKGRTKFFKHVRTCVVEISFNHSESFSNKVQCSCTELL